MKNLWNFLSFLLVTPNKGGIPARSLSSSSSSHLNHMMMMNNRNNDEEAAGAELTEIIEYSVCLSPGCISDGAKETLERLQALAPPNVIVQEGSCVSACGFGPVVVESHTTRDPGHGEDKSAATSSSTTKQHRRVKGAKIEKLLTAELDSSSRQANNNEGRKQPNIYSETPPEVIEGYDIVSKADEFFKKKDFQEAVRLYEEAISISFAAALEFQRLRERLQPGREAFSTTQTRAPKGLDWLIRARRNEAQALLEIGNVEDAMLAAQSACNLSRNTSTDAFQVLADIYRAKGDSIGELQSLQTMFALPIDDEEKLPIQVKNKRRELGFRLARLEREVDGK